MVALYLASVEAAGKSALCAGIGRQLLDKGIKAGFFVPIQLSEAGSADGREDAAFVKEAFELGESIDLLCPTRLSRGELWRRLTDEVADFGRSLKQAYAKISRGKDIVLMEGLSGLGVDNVATLACYTIAETLDAKVVVVLRYSSTLDLAGIAQIGKKLEGRLIGVVINFVPESRIEALKGYMVTSFEEAGTKVLGILPEVRSLVGVSIKELAEALEGEILTCPDNAGEIVESVMLGAMSPDSGINYFSRGTNKAAVIRGGRADMQLAALETSARCLILTDSSEPLPAVVHQSEDKHVPIIVAKQDISGVIAGIEEALAKTTFHSTQKLQRFERTLGRHFDFKALSSELSLKA